MREIANQAGQTARFALRSNARTARLAVILVVVLVVYVLVTRI